MNKAPRRLEGAKPTAADSVLKISQQRAALRANPAPQSSFKGKAGRAVLIKGGTRVLNSSLMNGRLSGMSIARSMCCGAGTIFNVAGAGTIPHVVKAGLPFTVSTGNTLTEAFEAIGQDFCAALHRSDPSSR